MTESEAGAGSARSRGVAAAAAALAVAGLVAVALATGGGGEDGEADSLRIERSQTELIVYVTDPGDNEPDAAGAAPSVTLECLDQDGEVLISAAQAWPFTDTDGESLDPHVHLSLDADRMQRVKRCRLNGTDPPLEGGVL
ncbi:MAG TPA: hypothetical protein VFQ12_11470 [Thermoleophilaceae bacterium]|nr:hypothetical protein [Thermoleophilaceae bacterium]